MSVRRNQQIYDWVIKDEYPVKLVVQATGLTRQGIHQILDRMIAKYGGAKQDYHSSGNRLNRMRIAARTYAIIKKESERLEISQSAVIRLAINQALKNELEFTTNGGATEQTHKTPFLFINDRQQEYLSSCATSLTKAEKIRQIIKNYKPIKLEVIK